MSRFDTRRQDNEKRFKDAPHIGHAHHPRRNAFILAGALGVGALIGGYAAYFGKHNAAEVRALESFRADYARQCNAIDFSGPTDPAVKKAYLDSPVLEKVVSQESSALRAGARCEDVTRALRAADFPMPPTAWSL